MGGAVKDKVAVHGRHDAAARTCIQNALLSKSSLHKCFQQDLCLTCFNPNPKEARMFCIAAQDIEVLCEDQRSPFFEVHPDHPTEDGCLVQLQQQSSRRQSRGLCRWLGQRGLGQKQAITCDLRMSCKAEVNTLVPETDLPSRVQVAHCVPCAWQTLPVASGEPGKDWMEASWPQCLQT